MKNIVLVGFMGSGKTTIGKALVELTNMEMLDTDKLISENEKTTISDIFATKGEPYFRQLETELVDKMVKDGTKGIISTGGGLVITPGNGDILKKLGTVVFLRTSKETIVNRLVNDTTRPLLAGGNLDDKTTKLLEYRSPIYEANADIIVDTDNKSPLEIAKEIVASIS